MSEDKIVLSDVGGFPGYIYIYIYNRYKYLNRRQDYEKGKLNCDLMVANSF